ncbi:hypothetical protein HMPREF1570_3147 [Klebsiella oxytoca KA-2]|nr:hypothetical protein HMPREF1570_3147 [Klebsiella oxytoca KA-2]
MRSTDHCLNNDQSMAEWLQGGKTVTPVAVKRVMKALHCN